ncbi:hypothetical protein [Streptomyces nigrescens]
MVERPFPSPSGEEVIEALERTGFLLEQRVAKITRSMRFAVTTGKAFKDPDEKKSREVDIFAVTRVFRAPELDVQVTAQVIIECKNSLGPYVILGREPSPHDRVKVPYSHTLPVRSIRWIEENGDNRWIHRGIPTWNWLGFHRVPHSPNLDDKKGVQMVRMQLNGKKWQADNSSIFDSLTVPLMKAVEAFRPPPAPYASDQRPRYACLNLCFPVVVTSGELYYVDGESENPSTEAVDWVTVERGIEMATLSGVFNMDVVTYPALTRYLKDRVLPFCEEVAAEVAKDPERLLTTELEHRPT